MISNLRYWFLLGLVGLVYVLGLFVPLLENDSAQFAVMAMRMVQENDFTHIFKGPYEYLDKPHMHFWLAALSFKLFGISDWAYRIPAILVTFLGAYSCYGLGKLLYTEKVGRIAALIFMTAQTIVLSVIDVRTDAVLTGFTIFAIWQLVAYIEKGQLKHIVLGAIGAGLAFSTKGQIALLVVGLCLLCHLGYTKKWKLLWSWKAFLGLFVFGLAVSPMLYAYYQQFDLQPEKVIRGKSNRSGIFFIFWEQSFERLSGTGMGKNSSDYFFFFHTFLWVFLPWTVLALLGYWDRAKQFWKYRVTTKKPQELLTFGGITILFFIISFAQFKLPHYLNILIPLFAILSAAYLANLQEKTHLKTLKGILAIQYVLVGVVFLFAIAIYFFVFVTDSIWYGIAVLLVLIGITYLGLKATSRQARIISSSACTAIMLNLVMNIHFYPSLMKYQGGLSLSEKVAKEGIPVTSIHKLNDGHSWALDFYNKQPVRITALDDLKELDNIWVYAKDADLETLQKAGLIWDKQHTVSNFRISRLQFGFLNPSTRAEKLSRVHLVHLP